MGRTTVTLTAEEARCLRALDARDERHRRARRIAFAFVIAALAGLAMFVCAGCAPGYSGATGAAASSRSSSRSLSLSPSAIRFNRSSGISPGREWNESFPIADRKATIFACWASGSSGTATPFVTLSGDGDGSFPRIKCRLGMAQNPMSCQVDPADDMAAGLVGLGRELDTPGPGRPPRRATPGQNRGKDKGAHRHRATIGAGLRAVPA